MHFSVTYKNDDILLSNSLYINATQVIVVIKCYFNKASVSISFLKPTWPRSFLSASSTQLTTSFQKHAMLRISSWENSFGLCIQFQRPFVMYYEDHHVQTSNPKLFHLGPTLTYECRRAHPYLGSALTLQAHPSIVLVSFQN